MNDDVDKAKKTIEGNIRKFKAEIKRLELMGSVYTHKGKIAHAQQCSAKISFRERLIARGKLMLKELGKTKHEKVLFT